MGFSIENPDKIIERFVNHFYSILNNYDGSNLVVQTNMLEAIPRLTTSEDNKLLNSPITLEEVRQVVFDMNPDKSPRPDGFQALFYQKYWDVSGIDMWKAIEAIRNGGSILSKINNTFITPIPKKKILKLQKCSDL